MRNLVIVMAGDRSLHEAYAVDRDFELWVCYWGSEEAVAARYRRTCDRFLPMKGQKWALVRELGRRAHEQRFPPFSDYDYILLPDDDIAFPGNAADIAKAFHLAREIGADCFQPAIGNEHFSPKWEWTRAWPAELCHAVNIVEIMMPACSGAVFERCVLPLLHVHAYVTVGWGLEALIVRMGEAAFGRAMRVFVLDAVPANHTRPVGGGSAARFLGWDEVFVFPQSHAHEMKQYARFTDSAEALRFAFPTLDDTADLSVRRAHLRRVRIARLMTEFMRTRGIATNLLNRVRKVDVRSSGS